VRFNYCHDGSFGVSIVDVLEIPSEQKIDSGCGGDANMQRILFTISRYCTASSKPSAVNAH
jgi:hypothetical protein